MDYCVPYTDHTVRLGCIVDGTQVSRVVKLPTACDKPVPQPLRPVYSDKVTILMLHVRPSQR
jgi:hypothetical protein